MNQAAIMFRNFQKQIISIGNKKMINILFFFYNNILSQDLNISETAISES